MAYAAAVYLVQMLKQLQQSDQFSAPLYPESQINALHDKIWSLKDFLERNSSLEDNSDSTNQLESQIRDAIYEAEDIIESHMLGHSLSSGSAEKIPKSAFTLELRRVIQDIDSIAEETKKVRLENDLSIFREDLERVIQDISSIAERTSKFREENDVSILPKDLQRVIQDIGSTAERSKKFTVQIERDLMPPSLSLSEPVPRGRPYIVGRNKDIEQLVTQLRGESNRGLEVVPIVGISGIGKTALAESVYKDQLIDSHFEIRAWIKVSREYLKRDILLGLLRSMGVLSGGQRQETDDQLARYLYEWLKSKTYLVVLDDICDVEAWNYLKELLPDYNNGSRVIITTRDMNVAYCANSSGSHHQVRELAEEESWDLLRQTVFTAPDELSPELEQVAKNIAWKCRGLPLAIIIIGRVLSNASIRGWKRAASSISVSGNYDELVEVVLSLTYRSLPQYTKACLLYMGIFPRNYEIHVSKLIKLWIAEGFLQANENQTLEEMAEASLLQLVDRSLVSSCEQSSRGGIKTCIIDDVFRDFIKRKAEEEKFFHVINKQTDGFLDDTNAQRRLCVLKNIRFGSKDVASYNSNASVETARSFLYGGPEHQHPLRVWLDFKLLRVLDALSIHFYSFPPQILKLVRLRYLAFTCNGELPASVCKLRNLQFLIILRKLSTNRYSAHHFHLPMEIWNMKELRHLQVMGRDLPDPSTGSEESLLANLSTLSDVTSQSCTLGLLRRIPNLKKLGIRIESPAHDGAEDFSFLSHLDILDHLESLKCVVVRPDFGSQVVLSVVAFPPSLRKLCLSGCGFSWEYMNEIAAALPNLEVLKLQNYSFRGPEWMPIEGTFIQLKFLLLEDMDVEYWEAESSHFPRLQRLIIRHCYKLREIPSGIGDIPVLEMIELDDCNPSAVDSVISILEEQRDFGNYDLQVRIPFSWNNQKFRNFKP